MLFNSYEFLLAYLPLTFALFFLLARLDEHVAAAWLALASIFFYGWWNPVYVPLLVGSIVFNFAFGRAIGESAAPQRRRRLLALAVTGDLGLLGYFKYANFFLDIANAVAGAHWDVGRIVLPLGISFFTFTQIAFLVDTYRGEVKEYRFVHYALFVTYFPHLIAGPVLHHKEMMPQFAHAATYRISAENVALGLSIFTIGLVKKVLFADNVAVYASPVFAAAAHGDAPTLLEAWSGALAYALQLYFDFSGYSDMAIGGSRLFGIVLPLNFDSPYKATSIVDFWRRWHMTLSRFLRDYLYVPLGGNRHGTARRHVNLMTTMLLGGLWHGAGWTFVVWGGLHGTYLVINHGWEVLRTRLGCDGRARSWRIAARALTFLAVLVGWVFFRAESFGAAFRILEGMAGLNGIVLPAAWQAALPAALADAVAFGTPEHFGGLGALAWIAGLLAIAFLAPNSQEIAAGLARDGADDVRRPRLGFAWGVACALGAAAAIASMNRVSEFLYFQF
ncbi:MAG: MBOAT family protein [Gammaproteobacteria bacterium]|nr:MBOAT family protein [Gammaproteobacteria bacterium]MBI5618823.1 MBOAT family protein [Gammaproteobacteria bacterium]